MKLIIAISVKQNKNSSKQAPMNADINVLGVAVKFWHWQSVLLAENAQSFNIQVNLNDLEPPPRPFTYCRPKLFKMHFFTIELRAVNKISTESASRGPSATVELLIFHLYSKLQTDMRPALGIDAMWRPALRDSVDLRIQPYIRNRVSVK